MEWPMVPLSKAAEIRGGTTPSRENPTYWNGQALTSAAVASELKLQVCRKAFVDSRGPCGRSIAAVLGSIADPLPDDAVQMLHWLATEDEDPVREGWQGVRWISLIGSVSKGLVMWRVDLRNLNGNGKKN